MALAIEMLWERTLNHIVSDESAVTPIASALFSSLDEKRVGRPLCPEHDVFPIRVDGPCPTVHPKVIIPLVAILSVLLLMSLSF